MSELFDILAYNYVKASAVTNISTAYSEVVTMTTPDLEIGIYELAYSFEANFNGQKNQPMFFRVTGTYAGAEFSESIGDNDTGIHNRYYCYPVEITSKSDVRLALVFKKGVSFTEQFDLNFVDVMIKRVK